MIDDVEAARQQAIARLQQHADDAAARAADPYWTNGPYNVQRWVERGYNAAISVLTNNEPQPGDDRTAYLERMSAAVREMRDLGPDADDEAWYSSAIDEACALITHDG